MGTQSSYNDEWIELFNQTDATVNLEGWTLRAADGSPKINLTGTLPARGFYVLERSKDYTGALNNKGEKLELFDNLGNLIDSIDASSGWPAGDNATKQTMERKDSLSWQTSQNPGGTPKAKNSILIQKITATAPKAEIKNEPVAETVATPESSERNSGWQSLAAVSEPISQTSSAPFIVWLTAVSLALFSGIIILALKKGLK